MKLEDLQKKIEHCERRIFDLDKEIESLEKRKKDREMYMAIYGATLHFLQKDWEGSKPSMEEFMKNILSEHNFDFWSRYRNDLFDVKVSEREYISELEWNHRFIRW